MNGADRLENKIVDLADHTTEDHTVIFFEDKNLVGKVVKKVAFLSIESTDDKMIFTLDQEKLKLISYSEAVRIKNRLIHEEWGANITDTDVDEHFHFNHDKVNFDIAQVDYE